MAKPKNSNNSAVTERWNKVFNSLTEMLHLQQTQLESIATDRKILQDRVKLYYDRWLFDVNKFQDQIHQMKEEFTTQEKEQVVEAAKAEFVISLKQRDAFLFKRKFEDADSELADFRVWFDYLSQKCSKPNDVPRNATNEKAETRYNPWKDDLKKLRTENERLTSEKNSEISALLSEKNFIWNQFKKLEHDTTEQLMRKRTEIEQANERIQALMMNIEELEVSNTDKDNTIATLRTQMAKFESDSARKSEEITRLSAELDLLKKSGSTSVTPVLRRRTAGKAKLRGTSHGTAQKNTSVMENPQSSLAIKRGRCSTKRNAGDSVSGAPKLFTSSFKVPKVKSSPRVT